MDTFAMAVHSFWGPVPLQDFKAVDFHSKLNTILKLSFYALFEEHGFSSSRQKESLNHICAENEEFYIKCWTAKIHVICFSNLFYAFPDTFCSLPLTII